MSDHDEKDILSSISMCDDEDESDQLDSESVESDRLLLCLRSGSGDVEHLLGLGLDGMFEASASGGVFEERSVSSSSCCDCC